MGGAHWNPPRPRAILSAVRTSPPDAAGLRPWPPRAMRQSGRTVYTLAQEINERIRIIEEKGR